MTDKVNKKEEKTSLAEKLFKFRNEITGVKRDAKAYAYKYATLEQVYKTIQPVLSKCRLCISSRIIMSKLTKTNRTLLQETIEDVPFVELEVKDLDSGESKVGVLPLLSYIKEDIYIKNNTRVKGGVETVNYNPIQAMGSDITYCTRYLVMTMLGLAAEDDDAQSNSYTNTLTKNKTPMQSKKKKKDDDVFKSDKSSQSASKIMKMISAFRSFNVSEEELKDFLGVENISPDTVEEEKIETLKDIYRKISSGANSKQDFFEEKE